MRVRRPSSRRSLLLEAHDTTEAVDWTPIRDVMQVRRRARRLQRKRFMQCLACTGFLVLFALCAAAVRYLVLWWGVR